MLSGVALASAAYVVARGNAGLGGVRPSVATENRSKSSAGLRSLIVPRTLSAHSGTQGPQKKDERTVVYCRMGSYTPASADEFHEFPPAPFLPRALAL
jgi:hypothetical protein